MGRPCAANSNIKFCGESIGTLRSGRKGACSHLFVRLPQQLHTSVHAKVLHLQQSGC